MATPVSILITSISKKIPLIKAVRHAAEVINTRSSNAISKIIGGDADFQCIGKFFVDDFWHIPFQGALTIDEIIRFCHKNHVTMIIPTRDGELPFFAKHKEELKNHGIKCLISSPQTIDLCSDKLLFYEFLKNHHFPSIPTFKHIEKIHSSSLVVKECFGAGAKSMGLDLPLDKAKTWALKLRHPIFQPFIRGIEYSIDIYIDKQGTPKGAIVRERELIKDGESQITSSIKMQDVETMCLEAARLLKIYGPAVFQVLRDESEHIHIIECNPRFGGASTLGVAMGLKSFEWFFEEALGLPSTPFIRHDQELRQVRFPEDITLLK